MIFRATLTTLHPKVQAPNFTVMQNVSSERGIEGQRQVGVEMILPEEPEEVKSLLSVLGDCFEEMRTPKKTYSVNSIIYHQGK